MKGEIAEALGLTEDEAVMQVVDGLKSFGAVYKHNLYIKIPSNSLLTDEHYQKKAKETCELFAKRVKPNFYLIEFKAVMYKLGYSAKEVEQSIRNWYS